MTNFHNTLYVTLQNAYVGLDASSLYVKHDGSRKMQVPLHHLTSVICFGAVMMSADAMQACAEAGVGVTFLSVRGHFLARVEGRASRHAMLRREQYRATDDTQRRLQLAKGFVAGKIVNSRQLLLRAARTRKDNTALSDAAERLKILAQRCPDAENLEILLGIEGESASRYFEVFDAMIEAGELRFEKRTRRPPENEINAMLSFGYTLLASDCSSALQAAGLDPAVGFLHAERSGRPALALDLMEEFRAIVVDKMVLAMVRLAQVDANDFTRTETNGVLFNDQARKAFLIEYQARKQDQLTHPALSEPVTWGMLPHIQARLLARAVRREGDYVPFFGK